MLITADFGEDGTPITTFTGPVVDQQALHGVLAKIRDVNMPLISVNQIEADLKDESQADLIDE